MKHFLFVFFLSSIASLLMSQTPSPDSLTLVNFFNVMNGTQWKIRTGWNTAAPLATWKGVTIDPATNRVTTLKLPANNLEGSIPGNLSTLISLANLDLSRNNISGPVSDNFSNFPQLRQLNLSGNNLDGSVVPDLMGIAGLLNLDISNNHIGFDGLSTIRNAYPQVKYSPQKDFQILRSGNQLSAIEAGGAGLGINTYYWYKNGILTTVESVDPNILITDSSSYHVRVTNSNFENMAITSAILVTNADWTFVGIDSTTSPSTKQHWNIASIAFHQNGLDQGVYAGGKLTNSNGLNYIGYWDRVSSTWIDKGSPSSSSDGKILKIVSNSEFGGDDIYLMGTHLNDYTQDFWGMYLARNFGSSWDYLPASNWEVNTEEYFPPNGVHLDLAANAGHLIAEGQCHEPADGGIMEYVGGSLLWRGLYADPYGSDFSIDTLDWLVFLRMNPGYDPDLEDVIWNVYRTIPQRFAMDNAGDVYAAGLAVNVTTQSPNKIFIAKWTRGDRKWQLIGNVFTDYGHSFGDDITMEQAVNNGVFAITVSHVGHNITVTGNFKNSNDQYYVARLDPASNQWNEYGTWQSLGGNFHPNGPVRTMVYNGSELYAAGDFTNQQGRTYVVKFDFLGNVDTLGKSLLKASHISSLSFGGHYNDDIYASGLFQDEAERTYYLAHFSPTNCATVELTGGDNPDPLLHRLDFDAQPFNTGTNPRYLWRLNHSTIDGNNTSHLELDKSLLKDGDSVFVTVYGYSDCSIAPVTDTFAYHPVIVNLPVQFRLFTGKELENRTIQLNWVVDLQQDVSHYILERSSDGRTYSALATIEAINRASGYAYTYLDKTIDPSKDSKLFYRVREVDLDSKISYSRVLSFTLRGLEMVVNLSQNPITNRLSFTVSNPSGNGEAKVLDIYGRVLMRTDVSAQSKTYSMDFSRFAKGVYFLRIEVAGKQETIKFVK